MKMKYLIALFTVFLLSACGSAEQASEGYKTDNTASYEPQETEEAAEYNEMLTDTKEGMEIEKEEEMPADVVGERKSKKMSKDKLSQEQLLAQNEKQDIFTSFTNFNLDKLNKKFIKTANIRFKVKSVRKATHSIEDITAKFGGFVAKNHILSQELYETQTPINKDSTLKSKFYRIENDLIIRVPSQRTDSLLREMNDLIEYLDYHRFDAKDVTIDMYANELRNKRYENSSKRIEINLQNRQGDVQKATDAESNMLDRELQADQAVIENMRIEDQIQYSTLTIHIYQSDNVFREVVKNFDNIDAYEPSIWSRLGESIEVGWDALLDLLVGFTKLWALWLVLIVGVLGFRWYRKNKSNKQA